MKPHRTLIQGGWIVSMDARVGDLPQGDLLIDGEHIAAVAPRIEAADAEVIDARGHIVLPGFVDTHRHTWQTCVRHRYADIDPQTYFAEMLGRKGAAYRPEDVYIGMAVRHASLPTCACCLPCCNPPRPSPSA